MSKIIKFFKDKYKILIPIMVAFVLVITLYFLYREYQYDNTRNKQEELVYQYFGGDRVEYTAILTYNLKNSIIDIEAKDKKVRYDSTPVYYQDEDKVLFPRQMTIVFPYKKAQYKLYKYATYYVDENVHFIKNNIDVGNYNYFFLYDGKNMFFFPDEVTIKLGGKDYKKLGAGSYVSVVGGLTLIYYDTATGTSDTVELEKNAVSVYNDFIDLNISEKYYMSLGSKILLITPENLNPVFKTIDN